MRLLVLLLLSNPGDDDMTTFNVKSIAIAMVPTAFSQRRDDHRCSCLSFSFRCCSKRRLIHLQLEPLPRSLSSSDHSRHRIQYTVVLAHLRGWVWLRGCCPIRGAVQTQTLCPCLKGPLRIFLHAPCVPVYLDICMSICLS